MPELGEPLSDREMDVLACMVQGAQNKEIAAELFISENTVKVHLRRIYTKLGVSSRTEATTVALQKGLVAVPGLETTSPVADDPDPAAADVGVGEGEAEPGAISDNVPETAVSDLSPAARPAPWRNLGLGIALVVIVALLGFVVWQQQNVIAPDVDPQTCSERPLGDSRWLVGQAMPEGRMGMATAAVGLDIYLIGGGSGQDAVNQVDVYDTANCQWRTGAPKPTAVSDTRAAVLFGEIYIPGGRGADGLPTSTVEVFSPANNLWRTIAPLPAPNSGGLVLEQGGLLYLFGGWDGESYLATAYAYNPALDSWETLPPMGQARAFATGGALSGLLFAVGGYDGANELNTCAAFDPAGSAWQACPGMLQPRAGAGAVVILNKLYVMGGGMQANSLISYGEEYNPATQTWQVVDTPMLGNAGSWFLPGIANIETRIYAFGGRQNETVLADTYVLRAVFQTFLPAMPNQ